MATLAAIVSPLKERSRKWSISKQYRKKEGLPTLEDPTEGAD